jgi:predicted DNA-binding protein with PD1-like motif
VQAKKIHEDAGQKTFALVFGESDEVMEELTRFAEENGLSAASFTALGAFGAATLGYFDMEEKDYTRIPVNEQAEVLSLVGTVAPKEDGSPQVHAHAVLGRSDGTVRGGHLLNGRVRPTLEVVLTESPAHLQRKTDEKTGLPLLTTEG